MDAQKYETNIWKLKSHNMYAKATKIIVLAFQINTFQIYKHLKEAKCVKILKTEAKNKY